MRRILLALVASLALAGCATQPYYAHYDDGADYYYTEDGYGSGGYVPDYISYGAYYDAMYPIYHNYYDPFYAPGFRYGVTYFPTNWFGFGGWGWGYPYWAYSPWRHSWYDGYYDWGYWDNYYRRADRVRFGNARNEAASVAALRRDTIPGGMNRFGGDRTALGRAPTRDFAPDRARDTGDTSMRNRRDIDGQVRTRAVDRYYGEPRVSRGEGPRRESFVERSYERGSVDRGPVDRGFRTDGRGGPSFERGDRGTVDRGPVDRGFERRSRAGDAPGRYYGDVAPRSREPSFGQDRAWRQPSPPMRENAMPQFRSGPADRGGGAPVMRSGPSGGGMPMRSAPMPQMRSAPAPQMRSAPSPSRSAPSAPSRGGPVDR